MSVNNSANNPALVHIRKELGEKIPDYWQVIDTLSTSENLCSFLFLWWQRGSSPGSHRNEEELEAFLDRNAPCSTTWSARVAWTAGKLGYPWSAVVQCLQEIGSPAALSARGAASPRKQGQQPQGRRRPQP